VEIGGESDVLGVIVRRRKKVLRNREDGDPMLKLRNLIYFKRFWYLIIKFVGFERGVCSHAGL